MNHGMYIAASGMESRARALDVAANNVANASTVGYKRDSLFFGIFNRVQEGALQPHLSNAAVAAEVRTDFSPGPLIRTDNTLDLALSEEGFFVVETPQGLRYTRNGDFTLDENRHLTTAQGALVLGQNGPLMIPEGEISVGQQGDISVAGTLVDRLRIAYFEDLGQLRKSGGVLFEARPEAVVIPPERTVVKQGFLEGSNVNPVSGMAQAMAGMRSFEMLSRAFRSLSQDVDRRVIDEVGRV